MPKIVDHAERRRTVLKASWRCIASRGTEKVTLRDISTEAGYTTGMIAHYFDSKADLLFASLELAVDELLNDVTAITPRTRLELLAVMDSVLPTSQERALRWRVLMWFWAESLVDPRLAERNREFQRALRAAITAVLRALVVAGTLPESAEINEVGRKLAHGLHGLGLDATFAPADWSIDRIRSQLARLVDDALRVEKAREPQNGQSDDV